MERIAEEIRRSIFQTICQAGGGHIAGSLSAVEILTVLYNKVMNVNPDNPDDPQRDRFVLSKGHAAVALYAVLAQRGYFAAELLDTFGHGGTILGGHPDMHKVPGVEASTGALGHGFGFATGMALAGKLDGARYRVFVLLGDGECQEGSIWEAAMFAPQHKLDNLVAIIDYNRLQALDRLDDIVSLSPLAEKWRAFGWEVQEVAGHDCAELSEALSEAPAAAGNPA